MPLETSYLWLALVLLQVAGMWLVFRKAGRPGWAALIPVYDLVVLMDVLGRSRWWVLWLFVPVVNIFVWLAVSQDLADAFGHGLGMTLALFLVPWIALLVLGLGSSSYSSLTAEAGPARS
jgi:hypothetical protein